MENQQWLNVRGVKCLAGPPSHMGSSLGSPGSDFQVFSFNHWDPGSLLEIAYIQGNTFNLSGSWGQGMGWILVQPHKCHLP